MNNVKWEYKIIQFEGSIASSDSETTDKLYAQIEQLGNDGWELISVTPIQEELGETTMILWSFKRPK